MSLTWFPFNADAYTGDTNHLTCEEHGAYLLLMLAYYRSEKPLPARDRSLAATCKLSLDAWMEAKPILAPFFREVDGMWRHDVIEETIKTQNQKMEDANKRAKDGANKRWAGHVPKPKKSRKDASSDAQALPESMPEQSLVIADLDLDLESNSLSSAGAREEILDSERATEPQAPAPGIGSPISADWLPDPEWVEETLGYGTVTREEIADQVKLFIAHKQETGQFSANWDASWIKGWSRYLDWKSKQKKPREKAAARIEVDHKPSEKDWDFGLKMIEGGGMWPRSLGPAPGLIGCQCPIELMEKWGINPVTGERKSK